MPKLTPGNRLYLYQLLRDRIGTGRQTLVSRVEEVLVADDLAPEDLGFASTRELLESLGDMVKVTVFKKGNTYATLLPNPEWDQLLAKSAGPSAQQKAAAKGKPWKHRTKAKALKPARPRHVRRQEAQAPAADGSAPGATAGDGTPQDAGAGPQTPSTSTAGQDAEPQATPQAAAGGEPSPQPQGDRDLGTEDPTPAAVAEEVTQLETVAQALDEGNHPQQDTPSQTEDGPAGDALPLEGVVEATRPKVPPTHHIKLTVTYDPYAGIERDIAATERNLSEAVLESTHRQADSEARAGGQTPTPRAVAPQEPSPETPSPEGSRPSAPAPQPKAEREPAYTLLDEAEEATVAPEPLLVGLPRDFEAEVYVPNAPLSLLYQLLPPDANPQEVLAEDWQVARSTRTYEGTRNLVIFPVHLRHEDGTPVRVTIRRTTRPASGRHWAVTAVDGNDGITGVAEDAGPLGLPEAGTAVERLLARSVELGSWDDALASLADVAAPESWDLPGHAGERGVLRLYLSMTWRAVLEQGLLATTAGGDFATFDTGLLSPLSEHVFACLQGFGDERPWELLGFSTTGEGELGSRLGQLSQLPHAPRYLGGFDDLVLAPGASVHLPRKVGHTLGDAAGELAAAAVRRGAADWRIVAPAVDVESGDRCLLLPIGTPADPSGTTRALCVERSEDGSLLATGVLGLSRAYVEARVVSRSMPTWLARPATADGTTREQRPLS